MAKPKHGGGRGHCTVCSHAKRAEIDQVLAQGLSFEKAAVLFGLNPSSLRRHKVNHPSGLTKLEIDDTPAAPDSDGDTAVTVGVRRAKLKAHIARTLRHLKQAEASESAMAISQANREYRLAMDALNIFEQKEEALRIAARQGNTGIVNVLTTEAWLDARRALVRALQPFPEARIAVSNALMGLERPDYVPDRNLYTRNLHQEEHIEKHIAQPAVIAGRATRQPAGLEDAWSDGIGDQDGVAGAKFITVT